MGVSLSKALRREERGVYGLLSSLRLIGTPGCYRFLAFCGAGIIFFNFFDDLIGASLA